MKQGHLRFTTRRSVSTAATVHGKGKAPKRASTSEAAVGHSAEPSDTDDVKLVSKKRKLDAEDEEDSSVQRKPKRVFDSRSGEENSQDARQAAAVRGPAKLNVADPRWADQLAAAKEKMGTDKPSQFAILASFRAF